MTRQRRTPLMELGIGLLVLGVVVRLAIWLTYVLGGLLGTLAMWAIIVGVVIAIIGAITDRR